MHRVRQKLESNVGTAVRSSMQKGAKYCCWGKQRLKYHNRARGVGQQQPSPDGQGTRRAWKRPANRKWRMWSKLLCPPSYRERDNPSRSANQTSSIQQKRLPVDNRATSQHVAHRGSQEKLFSMYDKIIRRFKLPWFVPEYFPSQTRKFHVKFSRSHKHPTGNCA